VAIGVARAGRCLVHVIVAGTSSQGGGSGRVAVGRQGCGAGDCGNRHHFSGHQHHGSCRWHCCSGRRVAMAIRVASWWPVGVGVVVGVVRSW